MDAGSEVSRKIRSAIKAKLEELGAYVDEELPDYIMVMVANKKTRDQMTDDLRLFLNKNAPTFTKWLHDIIDRLHNISKGESTVAEKPKKKPKDETSEKKERKTKQKKQKQKDKTPPPVAEKEAKEQEEDGELEGIEIHPEVVGDELDEDQPLQQSKESVRVVGRKRIEPPSPGRQSNRERSGETHRHIRRRSRTRSRSPHERRHRALRSSVHSSSQRRSPSGRSSDEYDPLHPEMVHPAPVSTVSSVVVSQRRFTVPSQMHPKPSIFLRAMHDAHKETKDVNEKKRKHKHEDGEEAESRSKKHECKRSKKKKRSRSSERSLKVKTDARKVEIKDESVSVGDDSIEPDEMLFVDVEKPPSQPAKKTRFVVTMEGLDESFRTKLDEKAPEEDEEMPEEPQPAPTPEVKPAPLKPIREPVSAPDGVNKENNGISMAVPKLNIQLDDDDDEDSEEIDAMLASSNNYVKGAVPIMAGLPTLKHHGVGKVLERCRFWPACKLGDQCEYMHPTTQCKSFPNCNFGDKCLFIHPNCRFDQKCTRRGCPFTHSTKQPTAPKPPPPAQAAFAPRAPWAVTCKFGAKCKNTKCAFKHPKLCKYGTGCTNPQCTYRHSGKTESLGPVSMPPRPVVDRSKFKWVSPAEPTPPKAVEAQTE